MLARARLASQQVGVGGASRAPRSPRHLQLQQPWADAGRGPLRLPAQGEGQGARLLSAHSGGTLASSTH